MATNLTPQYHKAEAEYRRASTAEDELKWLEIMLREMPKHKASEKLQSDLKQKISKAKKDLEVERKSGKKGHSVRVPRQGAGTALLLGGPNAGKSQLLASMTRATPEVAAYPFTTRAPLPGMMAWEDVMVQLIDTPPITPDFFETYMQGLVRAADLCLLVLDLGSDEGLEQCQDVLETLGQTKTRLARESRLDEDDVGLSFTQTLLVANKLDATDAPERLALWRGLCPLDWKEYPVSATRGDGLTELKSAIYQALDVVRVYTKLPTAKSADLAKPYTVRRGSTLLEMAGLVHQDFAENFKFARVWGSAVHDASVAKGDYVLHDKDIVELHA